MMLSAWAAQGARAAQRMATSFFMGILTWTVCEKDVGKDTFPGRDGQ
jgi:hypothetical protein